MTIVIATAIFSLWILVLFIFGYWIDPVRRGIFSSPDGVDTGMKLQDPPYDDYGPEDNEWEAQREAEADGDR